MVVVVQLSLIQSLYLLIESVGKITYLDFIKNINNLEIEEVGYCKTLFDSNLPNFDKAQSFRYITENNKLVTLEVLGINNDILQSRISIYYKSPILSFLSKVKNHYKILVNLLIDIYGNAFPLEINDINTLNYQNDKTVCYISIMRQNNIDIITINVGNRKYWG